MTTDPESHQTSATQTSLAPPADQLPEPRVKKMRWPFPLIWIIPFLAAVGAGYYFYRHKAEHGQEIVVSFTQATDLKIGDTPVVVHGVKIGKIKAIRLSDDQHHANVSIELTAGASKAGNGGTRFWIVRPDVAGGSLMGISTLISGPYVEALPGDLPPATEFTGLDEPPVLINDGMRIVLTMDRLEHLQVNSGVYYRGIQVGAVQDIRLSSDSTQVNATIVVWRQFTRLLRSSSKFWTVNGADVKGGIFSGVQLQVNSLRTLIAGGVEFATPDEGGITSSEGMVFTLYGEADKKWLKWGPQIGINQPETDSNVAATDNSKKSSMK